MNENLWAGLTAGIAGLLCFLTIHHFWIKPIWFILPPGLVLAGLGGLAVGWSYGEIQAGLPPHPWSIIAMMLLISAILAPSIILAQLREPLLDMETFSLPPGSTARVIRAFVLELALTATMVGAIAGWLLGHSYQATLATGVAGLIFALGPGHNIPFLGNTPATRKGIILLIAIVFVSSVVLVESSIWLTR